MFSTKSRSLVIIIITTFIAIRVSSFTTLRSRTPHTFLKMSTKSKSKPTSNIPHIPKKLLPSTIQNERTRILTKTTKPKESNEIIYWMKRDMRIQDNWALLTAHHFATSLQKPLRVVYTFPTPSALPQRWTERYVTFLYEGLACVEQECNDLNINFDVYYPTSNEAETLVQNTQSASVVICDFSPLRFITQCKEEVGKLLDKENIPLYEVDAHNVIPVWQVSDKREIGARTLRTKINKLLPTFCTHYPTVSKLNVEFTKKKSKLDLKKIIKEMNADTSVKPTKFKGGMKEGMQQFQSFLNAGLKTYDTKRNDPNSPTSCSSMSYWLNFGHVSFQRLALTVRALKKYPDGTASFIEEGLVRRELSDNYVFYTPDYDNLKGALGWAQETLRVHDEDKREWVYTKKELEEGRTHDDLWNAAQLQVVREGGMHGFMRMYWAKKILEWTPNSTTALNIAQYFNDKYALDGNDPNGYVGVGWSIMGIHDQGWKEREVFGKIRYMNYAGCKRKFKVEEFVRGYSGAKENSVVVLRQKGKEEVKAAGKKRKTVG